MPKLPPKRRCEQCGIEIVFAILAPTRHGRDPVTGVFEATFRDPNSIASADCRVLVGQQAWRPGDLREDVMVRREMSEEGAREFVTGFPHHRPHRHEEEQNA